MTVWLQSPATVSVEVRDEVPVGVLTTLYRRAIPDAFHADRSEQFYEWRFDNPDWSYRTYLAGRSGHEVGAVTGQRVGDVAPIVTIVDVVSLVGTERTHPLMAILDELCSRNTDAAAIAASGRAIPKELLRSFGFLADTQLPLSAVSSPSPYVVYPLTDDDSWTVAGLDSRREANWLLTFAEQDTR